MNRIHNRSDFKLRIVFSDSNGQPLDMTHVDFDLWFHTKPGSQAYLAAQQGGICRRCSILADGSVLVSFDNHRLPPGQLQTDFTFHTEDCGQPDGWNELNCSPVIPLELVEATCSSHRPGADPKNPILVNVTLPLKSPMLHHHVTREELNMAIERHVTEITASDAELKDILDMFEPAPKNE